MKAALHDAIPGAKAKPPVHPWDGAAAGWSAHAPLIRAWLAESTARMLDAAQITLRAHVLDVAAGAGDQTLDIAERVGPLGQVLATDISAAILLAAQSHFVRTGLVNVEVKVADAQCLDLSGRRFDAAVCRLGLMFCRDPTHAMQAIGAALKPGGRFSGLVFAGPELNPCLTLQLNVARRHAGLPAATLQALSSPGTLMSLGQPARLSTMLMSAGFVDVHVDRIDAPFAAASAHAYVDFLKASASPIIEILKSISTPARRSAWEDMAQCLTVYDTPTGWLGPKALLLFSGRWPSV